MNYWQMADVDDLGLFGELAHGDRNCGKGIQHRYMCETAV
jgi:hypothetical protein